MMRTVKREHYTGMAARKKARLFDPLATPDICAGYPHMLIDHYTARIREMRTERAARLVEIRTPRQARAYQERTQAAIAKAFGPRPPKTPLNACVTGVHEGPHARVEKVIFESRPGIFVTANLYLPKNGDPRRPRPGVIGTCGHAPEGKAAGPYQAFPQCLAAAGFVTLIVEPFSQGERDQYALLPNANQEELTCGHCCFAHNMMGKQQELVGEFFGMWRAWDAIRGLDYLLTRPEVDPQVLGLTGNSGGGTESTWVWALEDRFTMAAPSCFITTFAANLENELPADVEQYPPGVLGAGLEMADFLIARGPKPVLLLGQQFDFFDRRGLREAYADVRGFYARIGAQNRCALFIGPQGHGYSHHNQQAMTAFFHRHAGLKTPLKQLGPKDCEVAEQKKLWATPLGSTVLAGATPIYEKTAELARAQARQRKRVSGAGLLKAVRKVLGLDASSLSKMPPHFRALGPATFANFRGARFAIETETASRDDHRPRVRAFLLYPTRKAGFTLDLEARVRLHLPHASAEAELNQLGTQSEDAGLYALDVRGLGASMHSTADFPFFHAYGFDYMHHGHALMFGESLLGGRVRDVLRTLALFAAEGAKFVELSGQGQGALLAAFAALLAPQLVSKVTLRGAPISFLEWATVPVVRWPAANFPRGVLKYFDLPDVYRALGRRLRIESHWDANMKPVRAVRARLAEAAGLRSSY